MNVPINTLVTECPKKDTVTVSQCRSCPYFRGLEGIWPQVKIKCALTPTKPRKVELILHCPLAHKHVSFKKCLKCPLHQGFYGFHDNSPIVYCGVGNKKFVEKTPLLIAPFF